MGKSTVADMFVDQGIAVFDADHEVRMMQGENGILISAIEEAFPGSTGSEGVKRDVLGTHVFGNSAALARLEAIIHPVIAQKRSEFLSENSNSSMVVFDIPLLLEKQGADSVDIVVVVSAPADVQRERVLARTDMTEQKLANILALQMPDAEKRAHADYIIDTGCALDETRAQVSRLIEKARDGAKQDIQRP